MASRLNKKGYLTKLGGIMKSWHKRWMVLDPDQQLLYYYEDDSEKKLLGTIEVRDHDENGFPSKGVLLCDLASLCLSETPFFVYQTMYVCLLP
jgi:hypothetical protein